MVGIDKQQEDRKKYSDLIINSSARKKIIVAGPGTGKTYIFKELLKQKVGNALALTFTNNLVDDLKKDLDGLAETKTFHKFCIQLLRENPVGGLNANFGVFPNLPEIIKSDEKILVGNESNSDFDEAFQCLIEDDGCIDFYIGRANFYNAVGFNDLVYRVLQYFKSGSGEPLRYEQVVIDEFQDFNQLEVAFIEEMENVNPILIVGDDDQAIYDFKNASPDFIREKAKDHDYERFELPYCRRCTEVIIGAVNDIISYAKEKGNLIGRVEKDFFCYMPDKKQDCLDSPNIIHATCSVQTNRSPCISKFIEREIQTISAEERKLAQEEDYPCVLIIGPPNRRPYNYLEQINNFLINKGYNVDSKKEKDRLHILDGYEKLLGDMESNLAWRIILEFDEIADMKNIIKQTDIDDLTVVKRLPKEYRSRHEKVVESLNRLKENRASAEEQNKLEETLALSLNKIRNKLGNEEECENNIKKSELQEETDQLSIKITTFLGAKGLSGGFVFIVGLNNGTIPEHSSSPTDNEICQFIVALTRARKRCYLISNGRMGSIGRLEPSIFIDWIDSSKLNPIRVNANDFR